MKKYLLIVFLYCFIYSLCVANEYAVVPETLWNHHIIPIGEGKQGPPGPGGADTLLRDQIRDLKGSANWNDAPAITLVKVVIELAKKLEASALLPYKVKDFIDGKNSKVVSVNGVYHVDVESGAVDVGSGDNNELIIVDDKGKKLSRGRGFFATASAIFPTTQSVLGGVYQKDDTVYETGIVKRDDEYIIRDFAANKKYEATTWIDSEATQSSGWAEIEASYIDKNEAKNSCSAKLIAGTSGSRLELSGNTAQIKISDKGNQVRTNIIEVEKETLYLNNVPINAVHGIVSINDLTNEKQKITAVTESITTKVPAVKSFPATGLHEIQLPCFKPKMDDINTPDIGLINRDLYKVILAEEQPAFGVVNGVIADNPSDILNFTSADGSVTITPDKAKKTVDLKAKGGGGSGIEKLNGLTDKEQTFDTESTTQVKDFEFISAGGKHTLKIPLMDNNSEASEGFISKLDFINFANKPSKVYVDQEVAKKEDKGTAYTKAETDAKLVPKAEKTYVDTELGKKADKTTLDAYKIKSAVDGQNTHVTITDGVLKVDSEKGGYNIQGHIVAGDNITVANDGVDNVKVSAKGGTAPIDNGKKFYIPLYLEDNTQHLGLHNKINLYAKESYSGFSSIIFPGSKDNSEVVLTRPDLKQTLDGDYIFDISSSHKYPAFNQGLIVGNYSNDGQICLGSNSRKIIFTDADKKEIASLDKDGNLTVKGKINGNIELKAPITIGDLNVGVDNKGKKTDINVAGDTYGRVFAYSELNGKRFYSYGGSMGVNVWPSDHGSSCAISIGTFMQTGEQKMGDVYIGQSEGATSFFSPKINFWSVSNPPYKIERISSAINHTYADNITEVNITAPLAEVKVNAVNGNLKVRGPNATYRPVLVFEKEEGGKYYFYAGQQAIIISKATAVEGTIEKSLTVDKWGYLAALAFILSVTSLVISIRKKK